MLKHINAMMKNKQFALIYSLFNRSDSNRSRRRLQSFHKSTMPYDDECWNVDDNEEPPRRSEVANANVKNWIQNGKEEEKIIYRWGEKDDESQKSDFSTTQRRVCWMLKSDCMKTRPTALTDE